MRETSHDASDPPARGTVSDRGAGRRVPAEGGEAPGTLGAGTTALRSEAVLSEADAEAERRGEPPAVRPARAGELDEVADFYEGLGYGGGMRPADTVLLARTEDGVVGAVRLCEEGGLLVLRGTYVAEELRGTGIGSALVSAAVARAGGRACWCVPHAHLVDFYGRAGFVEVSATDAPEFLVERSDRYRAGGQVVTLMVRPGA